MHLAVCFQGYVIHKEKFTKVSSGTLQGNGGGDRTSCPLVPSDPPCLCPSGLTLTVGE